MKFIHNLIGGLAGAVALNIIHEVARKLDPDAPQVQLVGEEALSSLLQHWEVHRPKATNCMQPRLPGTS